MNPKIKNIARDYKISKKMSDIIETSSIDVADIITVLKGAKSISNKTIKVLGDNRVKKHIKETEVINDIKNAKGAIINIVGDDKITLDDVRGIITSISKRLNPDARIIWASKTDDKLKSEIRTDLIYVY